VALGTPRPTTSCSLLSRAMQRIAPPHTLICRLRRSTRSSTISSETMRARLTPPPPHSVCRGEGGEGTIRRERERLRVCAGVTVACYIEGMGAERGGENDSTKDRSDYSSQHGLTRRDNQKRVRAHAQLVRRSLRRRGGCAG
jgi:hypothetical protein